MCNVTHQLLVLTYRSLFFTIWEFFLYFQTLAYDIIVGASWDNFGSMESVSRCIRPVYLPKPYGWIIHLYTLAPVLFYLARPLSAPCCLCLPIALCPLYTDLSCDYYQFVISHLGSLNFSLTPYYRSFLIRFCIEFAGIIKDEVMVHRVNPSLFLSFGSLSLGLGDFIYSRDG